ncbi:hypothetical protein B296_00058427 [Ensete ventricosum]|uniref:Uncharacterized protein n=1 Tax=Ensete ventricosum TaxID=4639 RepID=A0A426XJS4_ENSVE|nr:hypothetical protein B296_00058427 [Ensete ventricosum]
MIRTETPCNLCGGRTGMSSFVLRENIAGFVLPVDSNDTTASDKHLRTWNACADMLKPVTASNTRYVGVVLLGEGEEEEEEKAVKEEDIIPEHATGGRRRAFAKAAADVRAATGERHASDGEERLLNRPVL